MDSILALAETMVIKFEDYASPMNLHVIENHGIASVDEYDKASWKYYQNITGTYHFSDTLMRVASMDLPIEIVFNKANLELHQTTKSAYKYGSRYYRELVQRYPDQEQLILGILYPCDLQTALDAPDGTILGYPSYLVEQYEASLIPNLQKWIFTYLGRWVNRPFAITEDLYTAAYTGQLYLHLVGAITNARKVACHTEEVHSFHLQQYLASHGHLDVFIKYLTREQVLFLYRNINYIQRFAGKINTFDWLVQKIITLRGFPLYSYSMNHQIDLMSKGAENVAPVILPETTFLRKGVNELAQINARENFTLEQVLFKTEPLAPGNPDYQRYNKETMRSEFAYSPSSVVNTKLLESSAVDYSTVVGYTIEAIALQHWLRHVAKNKYLATVVLNLPHNPLSLRVSSQNAVALFLYCVTRAMCSNEQHNDQSWVASLRVPKFNTFKVMRDPLPTFNELRTYASKKYVSDITVNEILDTGVELNTMISVDAFFDYCTDVFKADKLQYRYTSMQEHHYVRSEVELLGLNLYADETNTLTELNDTIATRGQLYVEVANNLGLDFSAFTQLDFYNSALALYQSATGVGTKSVTSQSEIQKAMVSLFTKLSSYSIQMVQDTSVANLVPLHLPGVMVGDIQTEVINKAYIISAPVTIVKANVSTVNKTRLDADVPIHAIDTTVTSNQSLDVGLDISHRNSVGYRYRLDVSLKVNTDALPVSTFNNLSLIQKSYLIDGYGFNPDSYLSILQAPLGKFILQPYQREISVLNWQNEQQLITPWILSKSLKEIDVGQALQSFKSLNAFTWESHLKNITDITWSSSIKELVNLRFSDGYVSLPSLKYYGNVKTIRDRNYSPLSKDIEFTITRYIKQLDMLTYSKPSKELPGFSMGTGGSGIII